jgi:hypothetical protein
MNALSGFEKFIMIFFSLLFIYLTVGKELIGLLVANPLAILVIILAVMIIRMINIEHSQKMG